MHKSDTYSTDTLVKSLQRSEGLLWQREVNDQYHKSPSGSSKAQKTYQRSPPSLEFLPNYDQGRRNFESPRPFDREYQEYRRFDQQLSPRERQEMQKGQKRYRQ